jgi:hypothetical protein
MEGMGERKATLRCVKERYEARETCEDRTSAVVGYEVYRDTKSVGVPVGGVGRALGTDLSFPLPGVSLAPPTSLGERPPVYWELEVKAEASGVDYAATFLVPVYAR